jgi:hypothetical protein
MVVHSMKEQASFGFVTGCHAGDKFMVQAALVRSLTLFKMRAGSWMTFDGLEAKSCA